MNLPFCTAPPNVYVFLMTEVYPVHFAPYPPAVTNVPDYTVCTNNNKHATVKAMNVLDKKTRANIITMNTALANVFLDNLLLPVHASFHITEPQMVILKLTWYSVVL
jgi:hypothetical protein